MHSMTGCGRGSIQTAEWTVTVELKSVNHRFLDVSLRVPRTLAFAEDVVRKAIGATLKRGHVDAYLTVSRVGGSNATVTIDENLTKAYYEAAARLAELTGQATRALSLSELMKLEGVLQITEADMDEDTVSALCREAAQEAVDKLQEMRTLEGEALQKDLGYHLDQVALLREQVLERAPLVVEEYRAKLSERLSKLSIEPVDPTRLAQEVALMADHCAIDEELSRLDSHIQQMRTYLTAKGEIGKKMDFLIQEMNRETNTIGSKASDAAIAKCVVDMKSEIEKLREQIQNVE